MENTSEREKGTVEINGVPFYYEIAGKGSPVVWVHAGVADRRMWDDQFELFRHGYTVVRYDQRGFGLTPKGEGSFSYLNDLKKLVEFWGFDKVALVGCSMGGRTIIDYTLENPGKVAGLVTVCAGLSGFNYDGPISPEMTKLWEEADAAEAAGDTEKLLELEIKIWVDGPRSPEQVRPGVREKVREMNKIALQNPVKEGEERGPAIPAAGRLGEIQVPTLVVIGELDNPAIQAIGDKLATEIPHARKFRIADANHLPNMEHPQEFNREVMLFLGSLGEF
jgi:pimeloyl-ACP methyl ester carboxylesterase